MKLRQNEPLSIFAFNVNLRRYSKWCKLGDQCQCSGDNNDGKADSNNDGGYGTQPGGTASLHNVPFPAGA